MKFAMMSLTMTRNGASAADVIAACQRIGLDAIDWVGTCGLDAQTLKKMSDDAGLTVIAHTFFLNKVIAGDPLWRDEIDANLENAVRLGAPMIVVPTPPLPQPATPAQSRARWIEVMAEVVKKSLALGLVPCIENFLGDRSPIATAADFYLFKQAIPELKLAFDSGNAATAEDEVETCKKCLPDIVHVHLKDWEKHDDDTAPYKWHGLDGKYYLAAPIGAGPVDNAGCVRVLEAAGYQGYFNLEYEAQTWPAEEGIARAAAYLRSLF